MLRTRSIAAAACLLLVVSACGDDSAGTTGVPASAASTSAPGDTTAATAPTTTAATTTTAPVETTTAAPADAHQSLGGSWAAVWPAAGEAAAYRVTKFDGTQEDVPAVVEYGVDFRGETFDRIVFGVAESGSEGLAVYFDRSEPWVLKLKAAEVFTPEVTTGPILTEMFATPLPFDGSLPFGETYSAEVEVLFEFMSGSPETFQAIYTFTGAATDQSVEVAFGTVEGAVVLDASVGGEFIFGDAEDGDPFEAQLTLHPEHFLVMMTGTPAWNVVELLETWT